MKKQIIRSPLVPNPVGRFSQAVAADGAKRITFLSAVHGASAAEALSELHTLLDAAGYDFDSLVQVSVAFLDLEEVPDFVTAADTWFAERLPAVSMTGVTSLPEGHRVQITAIAAS